MIILAEFKPTFAWLKQRPLYFLAFGFGSGLAAKAPGTWGTLVALPLAFILYLIGIHGCLLAFVSVALFFLGIYICGQAEKELGIQDYGGIVWDEIVAMLLILAYMPFKWYWWVFAFIVFRLFDALKPWPIKWFDNRVGGGFGIMLDDMIAAFMTLIVVNLVMWIT